MRVEGSRESSGGTTLVQYGRLCELCQTPWKNKYCISVRGDATAKSGGCLLVIWMLYYWWWCCGRTQGAEVGVVAGSEERKLAATLHGVEVGVSYTPHG